jgi:hypothetical protein
MSAIVIGGAEASGYMRKRLAGAGISSVRFLDPGDAEAAASARALLPGVDLLVLGRMESNSPSVEGVVAEARALHVPVIQEENIGRPVGFP